MKRILIVLILFLLVGCKAQVQELDFARELDDLLSKRLDGDFEEAAVYDLRDGDECYNGHIPGFTCVFYDNDDTLEVVLSRIEVLYKKRALILFICEDGSVSKEAADQLVKKGYKNVYYFKTGYSGYVAQTPNFIPEVGCEC